MVRYVGGYMRRDMDMDMDMDVDVDWVGDKMTRE